MSANDWRVYEHLKYGPSQGGEGVIGDIKQKHLAKLKSRPKNIEKFMKKHGEKNMYSLKICRTPVKGVIQRVINFLTKGKLERLKSEKAYDDVFHLYVIITFQDGSKYELQKNDLVEIKPFNSKLQPSSECERSLLTYFPTFNSVMLRLEDKYPDSLYLYRAWSYNCQDFLKKFANASGITSLDKFILQDFSELFKKKRLKKFARVLTDLSASVKRYILGKGPK